jgi:cell division protein FtsB
MGEVCRVILPQFRGVPPMIVKAKNRLAFLFGRQSALRATSDAVDQLTAQLAAERAKVAGLNREVASLIHEIAKMQAPGPSSTMH